MVIQEKSIKDALEHIKAHVENASQESTNFESARTILNEMVRLEKYIIDDSHTFLKQLKDAMHLMSKLSKELEHANVEEDKEKINQEIEKISALFEEIKREHPNLLHAIEFDIEEEHFPV